MALPTKKVIETLNENREPGPYLKSLRVSEREIDLLEALTQFKTVGEASEHLIENGKTNMTLSACYNLLARLRIKQLLARNFINTMLGWRNKSTLHKKLLTPRVRIDEDT